MRFLGDFGGVAIIFGGNPPMNCNDHRSTSFGAKIVEML